MTRLSLPILGCLLALAPSVSLAATASVRPTTTPADYAAVRSALQGLSAGDTLFLETGVFDWSANISDTSATSGIPGGLEVPVPGLSIIGRKGTILRGARNSKGHPILPKFGTNAAFRNAPGVHNVTLKTLTLEYFENGVVLTQSDSLGTAHPHGLYKGGTIGWRIEDLWVRSGPFGVTANGGHIDLVVRRCRFELALGPVDVSKRAGSFAVGIRPYPPAYTGLPRGVVVEDNLVRLLGRTPRGGLYTGIIVTSDSAHVRRNDVQDYGIGLVVEGRDFDVSENRLSRCGIGIVAWTTGRLGTETERASIRRNEIRSMSRRSGDFLAAFTGSGILLAGVQDSDITGNILSANTGADIVFGAVESTKLSAGNRVTSNGGVVLLSQASREANVIEGSQAMVRNVPKPPPPPKISTP